MPIVSRRIFLAGAASLIISPDIARSSADLPLMIVNKDPSCGCCSGWVEHVRQAGFQVKVVELSNLAPIKARLGVPRDLHSCHTAEVGGYVIEGHVPASAIRRLLTERPTATGLAVPAMPVGSPGMEVPGSSDDQYDVILFEPSGQRVFARFQGLREL
jgi:hypothetical protein